MCDDPDFDSYLTEKARSVREQIYGKDVYIRGLIEFTNYCKNNCRYCGIRGENKNAVRYRLSEEEIISCSDRGYELGFRTFVLQGGEDPYFTDDRIVSIVRKIKEHHPDAAVTLSIGEKEKESYQKFFDAGANVVMPKLSPKNVRDKYLLYDNKICTGDEAAECIRCMSSRVSKTGYQVVVSRGDHIRNRLG